MMMQYYVLYNLINWNTMLSIFTYQSYDRAKPVKNIDKIYMYKLEMYSEHDTIQNTI